MESILSRKTAKSVSYPESGILVPMVKNGEKLVSETINLPKILFITTFPPRECGIATYSQDLINALSKQFHNTFQFQVCAIETGAITNQNSFDSRIVLREDLPNSYIKSAFYINKDVNIKIVVIQHEFGLFSAFPDEFLLMCKYITKPIVIVFHTVLPNPNESIKEMIKSLSEIVSSIIVMTSDASRILVQDYNVPVNLISIIPHGTHLLPSKDKRAIRDKLQLSGKKILTTFGLLSSSKNIETTLEALPNIISTNPETLFLVLGKTHPNILLKEGEKYRNSLEQKVIELGLQSNVLFINRYLETNELLEYLHVSDVYLFTSKDRNQAVSGTFSYAISSGCAVVSTPIPHAKEVINGSNGIIISFENPLELANAVNILLENDTLRAAISSNSLHKMASTSWQNSSIAHARLFSKLISPDIKIKYSIPSINLNHIYNMTTSIGFVQFAKIATPDLNSGYTLDDNSRALIAVSEYYQISRNSNLLKLIYTYYNFITYCFQPDGVFLNYVDKDGEFTEQNYQENLEDSNGRAIWALGYLTSLKGVLPIELVISAGIMLQEAILLFSGVYSPRAIAFALKGLYHHNSELTLPWINLLSERLFKKYQSNKSSNWLWFEDYLTYGNSILPEAMLLSYLRTKRIEYMFVAKESFEFLLSKIFVNNRLKVISNKGWMVKGQYYSSVEGGEQPIDVAYTIVALHKFQAILNPNEYKLKIASAFNWFLGDNHLNQIVYNPSTGGCYDGVEEHNVNLNQGAESTLSYLLARLVIFHQTGA